MEFSASLLASLTFTMQVLDGADKLKTWLDEKESEQK